MMSRAPTPRAAHTSTPIHSSHTASVIQSCTECGGIASGRRLQGLTSGNPCHAISYVHLLRGGVPTGPAPGSSIVITLLAPWFPHGGGAPSPTRIVITGNGGTSFGHGVRQSLTTTSRSIGCPFRAVNALRPTPMSVPPPPYSSIGVPANAFLTSCTAASQHATTT